MSSEQTNTDLNAQNITDSEVVLLNSSAILYGDCDLNGAVNSLDFARMRGFLLGMWTLGGAQAQADVNADGTVNSIDFGFMRMFLLGYIDVFPADEIGQSSITSPSNDNAKYPSKDIVVSWDAVPQAQGYYVSVRDLTINQLILNGVSTGLNRTRTIAKGDLREGHKYRIAVRASTANGDVWMERTFVIVITEPDSSWSTAKKIQHCLDIMGFETGGVDGVFGVKSSQSLILLQFYLGNVTGNIDSTSYNAVRNAANTGIG